MSFPISTEILIAIGAVIVPGMFLGGWKLFARGAKEELVDIAGGPIMKALADLKEYCTMRFNILEDDTIHLRNNGHEVRDRLNQGAKETEAIRQELHKVDERVRQMETRI